MNSSLSVSCFRFPHSLNTLVATRMGEAACQVRQTPPTSAFLHRDPTPGKTVPLPPTTRKHRARRDRGFISAPTEHGASLLRAGCRSVMRAGELHQSCASRVASQHCPLCSPLQIPRPSRLISSSLVQRRNPNLGIPRLQRLGPRYRVFPQVS